MGNRASSYLDDSANLLTPAAITATTYGTGVDLSDYDGYAHVVINVTTTHATAAVVIKMQDSADNSTFADVAGDTFLTTGAAAVAGVQVIRIDTRDYDQYIRAYATVATTEAMVVSATLIGRKKYTD